MGNLTFLLYSAISHFLFCDLQRRKINCTTRKLWLVSRRTATRVTFDLPQCEEPSRNKKNEKKRKQKQKNKKENEEKRASKKKTLENEKMKNNQNNQKIKKSNKSKKLKHQKNVKNQEKEKKKREIVQQLRVKKIINKKTP